jgi:hypothetical protein
MAHAITFAINGPPNEVGLQVGNPGAGVTTVAFAITAANAGNGAPITGTPTNISVIAWARHGGCQARNAMLTVSTPAALVSGGNTIPFNAISWTTTDADIAAGTYAAPGTVTLANFQNCQQISNQHTFIFGNVNTYAGGTYNGTATYTVTMP